MLTITADQLDAYARARVVECGDCLRWTGSVIRTGTGHPCRRLPDGRSVLVRRHVWESLHGPIAAGKILRCTCETPLCIAHLKLTTYRGVARECAALGLMSGPVRSGRIAATKRAGWQAKITQEAVREFRAGDESAASFARRHGISESVAFRIRRNELRREFAGNVWAGLA